MPIDENKIKQVNKRSEYFQDILDKMPSRIVTWGATGMLIIFVLIALALKFIKYPDVITSQALVTTENPPVEIYSRTSGRIIHLLKKDQEKVKKDEWVIILNNSADYKDVLKMSKMIQGINPRNFWQSLNEIGFEESLTLGDIQNAYFQFSRNVGELKLFLELNSQPRQLSINSKREESLMSLKQSIVSQLAIQEKEFAIVKLDYERATKLNNEGYVSKTDLEQKEIAYLASKSKVEELNKSMINTQLQIEMLNKENTTLETDKTDIYFRLRSNVLQSYNNLLFGLSEWKNKYVLESPIDGTINFYDVRTEDQFLMAEQKIFTVTPLNAQNYFAIIKLPISNSGKVCIGQLCIIKLSNYPYTEFGMLKGRIQSISSAAKEGFYSVSVELPDQLTTTLHKELHSKSELMGEADIIIEDQSLFDRIFNSLIVKNY